MYGSTFTYLNYNTKEFDSILTNQSSNGGSSISPILRFNEQSPATVSNRKFGL
jgi:hypothetical protein